MNANGGNFEEYTLTSASKDLFLSLNSMYWVMYYFYLMHEKYFTHISALEVCGCRNLCIGKLCVENYLEKFLRKIPFLKFIKLFNAKQNCITSALFPQNRRRWLNLLCSLPYVSEQCHFYKNIVVYCACSSDLVIF